jgi:hypothetical protein
LFTNVRVDKKTQQSVNEYGWRTTGANRDLMIDDFIEMFEDGTIIIHSSEAISQMKTFVRKSGGRREHADGYHDDTLFALFLCVQGYKYHRPTRVFARKAKGF